MEAELLRSVDAELLPEVMADATATVYESLNPDLLPDQEGDPAVACPFAVRRAIVLEAARLLFRKQTPHGIASFGDVALRLRTVDVDVAKLLGPLQTATDP